MRSRSNKNGPRPSIPFLSPLHSPLSSLDLAAAVAMAVDTRHLRHHWSDMACAAMGDGETGFLAGASPQLVPLYGTHCDSGMTLATPSASGSVTAPRKRVREGAAAAPVAASPVTTFLGVDMSAHVQQQLLDVDRIVSRHTESVLAELAVRRRRFARQMASAVETAAARHIRAKEEEIERMARINLQLEERVQALELENQLWRDVAESNETAANALRGDLELMLAARAGAGGAAGDNIAHDDAESACCGAPPPAHSSGERCCRVCNDGDAAVLLLPCRHLCVCAGCGAAARGCPVCGSAKSGCVQVNFQL